MQSPVRVGWLRRSLVVFFKITQVPWTWGRYRVEFVERNTPTGACYHQLYRTCGLALQSSLYQTCTELVQWLHKHTLNKESEQCFT